MNSALLLLDEDAELCPLWQDSEEEALETPDPSTELPDEVVCLNPWGAPVC